MNPKYAAKISTMINNLLHCGACAAHDECTSHEINWSYLEEFLIEQDERIRRLESRVHHH